MEMHLEVAVDVDRAKDFDKEIGWRLDADLTSSPDGNRWLLQQITTRLPGR